MLTRVDLAQLAAMRLEESRLLLENGLHSGAYYLAGYAAELALKVPIAAKFAGNEIPDRSFVNAIYTHDLEKLITHAGLLPASKHRSVSMDTNALVDGGEEGLRKIVLALEAEGVPVSGAYLIRLTSAEGFSEIVFRIVTTADSRQVIYKIVRLRRDGKIPILADDVRINPIRPNDMEAKRVLDYAARIGGPTVAIKDVNWDRLFIEDAVVVKWPKSAHALA